ncbi:MAG: ribonuclease J [Bacillota bacterium]
MSNETTVQIIPLGGIGEIGKNMFVVQCREDIMIIDAGLKFPEDEMLGIDFVIPNISYLVENQKKVRGIVLTHGHEDHIGAIPFILKQISLPIYGSRLTLGILKGKLEEHGLQADLHEVRAGDEVKLGKNFKVGFIANNHSVPDGLAMAVETPLGVILHSGDFKLDQTPVDGRITDYRALVDYGRKGVLALLCDSTNAHRPGYTPSERVVGRTFDAIFNQTRDRIFIATFASNIHRIQQALDVAMQYGRKVAVVGRSMVNNVRVARELGYLNFPEEILVEPDEINRYPAHKVLILTTGSQGEPLSGLARMANQNHNKLSIVPGDTVILSSTPVPGNEKLVNRVIDGLSRAGALVISQGTADVHVSGHASQEELKLLLNLVQPKYAIPVHGEYRHMSAFARLAKEVGIPEENIFVMANGDILEFTQKDARIRGKVPSGVVLVDGLGIGDVGNVVLRDRQQLAQDGVLVVVMTIDKASQTIKAGPDIITRGFVYVRESEDLIAQAEEQVKKSLETCLKGANADWSTLKAATKDALSSFLFERTRRRPMILPIIMEV